ncbi:MAG: carboxymuconolactone decarboxylase family protein [Dysgonomonas sp.]
MENLNEKQQQIVAIAANTATGNLSQLRGELSTALDAGLTVNEIKEVLVQMYAYCGFPRSLQGINAFMSVLDERKAAGIKDEAGKEATPVKDNGNKYQTGKKNLQTLTGVEEKTLSGANAFAPAIDTFLKEHLFADIFERDILTFQQRELATISALMAMPGVEPMLQSHINMGMNTGLTENQIKDVITIIGNFISKQQTEIGTGILKKVVESRKQ